MELPHHHHLLLLPLNQPDSQSIIRPRARSYDILQFPPKAEGQALSARGAEILMMFHCFY